MEKSDAMKEIRDEVLTLTSSPLYEYRTQNKYLPVIGEGSHDANIMFVGEAPGRNEAQTGKPFCGAAGRILDELLASIELSRTDIYITNIVKDRPPENRDPLPEEIFAYGPFLDRQIDIIQPKVIATLGRFSMGYILERFNLAEENKGMGKLHGKVFATHATYGEILVVVLYHPAAAIYNQALKETLRDDMQVLKKFI